MINRAQHIVSLISEGILSNLKKRYQDNYNKYIELEKNYYTNQRSRYNEAPPPPRPPPQAPPPPRPQASHSPNWTSPNPGLRGDPSVGGSPNWTSPGGHSSSSQSSSAHSSSYESPRSKQQQPHSGGVQFSHREQTLANALLAKGFAQQHANPYVFFNARTGEAIDVRHGYVSPSGQIIMQQRTSGHQNTAYQHQPRDYTPRNYEQERIDKDWARQEKQMDRERKDMERNLASWGREFDRESRAFHASLED